MSIQKCKPSFDDASTIIKRAPFTQLYNKVIQTCTNMEAIAVWAYLQSQVDNWELSPTQLKKHFGIGKNKIYKILSYMISANLLVRHVQIAQNGRHITTSYTVLDGTEFLDPARDAQDFAPLPQYQEVEKREVENRDTRKERDIEKKEDYKESNSATTVAQEFEYENLFLIFWNLYPVKKNKLRAKKLWLKHRLHEIHDLIIKDISNRLINDSQWQDKKFIPHPSTYIANELWNDELITAQPKPKAKESNGDSLSRVASQYINKGATYDHATGNTIDALR